jgi:hypothetical protein
LTIVREAKGKQLHVFDLLCKGFPHHLCIGLPVWLLYIKKWSESLSKEGGGIL